MAGYGNFFLKKGEICFPLCEGGLRGISDAMATPSAYFFKRLTKDI
jgi:hypothetical protein